MTSLLMPSPPISISHRLFQCRYSNSRDVVASSPSFSGPAARAPQRPCSQARAGAAVVLIISSIVLCLCTRLPLGVCVNGKHPSPLPLPQLVLPAFYPPSWSQFLLFPIPRAPFAKIKMDFNYTQQYYTLVPKMHLHRRLICAYLFQTVPSYSSNQQFQIASIIFRIFSTSNFIIIFTHLNSNTRDSQESVSITTLKEIQK